MYIAINFTGVMDHLLILEEEKRKIAELKAHLQKNYHIMLLEMHPNVQMISECINAICKLEDSVGRRYSFLENLIEDFKKASSETGSTLDNLEYQLNQSLSEK